ncbi:hypothetical protein SDC9_120868 [bioreactor metagenome]|uniref:Uncharacterized protein n=1 Tax=bioreactor metagenome TaxID=1076179 RepID=A0A645CAD0_9ZZZZ
MKEDEQRGHGHGQPDGHAAVEQAQNQQHQEHQRKAEGRGPPQAQPAPDDGRQESADDAEHVEHQRTQRGLAEVLAEQRGADQRQVPAHGKVLDGLAYLHRGRQQRARQVDAAKDQQYIGQPAPRRVEHGKAFGGRRGLEAVATGAVDARHGAGGVIQPFLACQPGRAFHQQRSLHAQDEQAEHRRGGHRIAPQRIAHIPGMEPQRQHQVAAHGHVPHALPDIEPALESGGRELGQHRHGDGEVDAIGRAHEEAAEEDGGVVGRHADQQRTGHGQHLGDDQGAHAAPAVGHPAADGIEGNGHPGGQRRHPGHFGRRQLLVARHGAQAHAECGVGECVEEKSAECQPPEGAGAA